MEREKESMASFRVKIQMVQWSIRALGGGIGYSVEPGRLLNSLCKSITFSLASVSCAHILM